MASSRTATAPSCAEHEELLAWLEHHDHLHIDVGTGDGAYALHLARQHPGIAVLGLDTHLGNLTKPARKGRPNLRFIACDAGDPPAWLRGRADALTVNFPYGKLLHALIGQDAVAQAGIFALARTNARIEIRVNASAGAAYGVSVDAIRDGIAAALRRLAPHGAAITVVPHHQMRTFPSTWAKRLAFGRPTDMVIATAVLSRQSA